MNGERVLRWYGRGRSLALTTLVSSSFLSFGTASGIMPPLRLGGAGRMRIGARVYIGGGCWLNCIDTPENSGAAALLSIGDDVVFSGSCTISAVVDVRIGDRALIAQGVYISDHSHRRGETRTLLDVGSSAAVNIGDGAWIGHNSCVLPGVSIGAGAVIGANSVVTRSIPQGGVAVGAPARVVKILYPGHDDDDRDDRRGDPHLEPRGGSGRAVRGTDDQTAGSSAFRADEPADAGGG